MEGTSNPDLQSNAREHSDLVCQSWGSAASICLASSGQVVLSMPLLGKEEQLITKWNLATAVFLSRVCLCPAPPEKVNAQDF